MVVSLAFAYFLDWSGYSFGVAMSLQRFSFNRGSRSHAKPGIVLPPWEGADISGQLFLYVSESLSARCCVVYLTGHWGTCGYVCLRRPHFNALPIPLLRQVYLVAP